MTVSVVIPFRDKGDQMRAWALEWICRSLRNHHPEWEIVVSDDGRSGDAPFSVSTARNRGVAQSSGSVVAIFDADTWVKPERLDRAVELVEEQGYMWVQPHSQILRLSRAQTLAYQAVGSSSLDDTVRPEDLAEFEFMPEIQGPGDTPTVITRELYEKCPQDPRLEGYSPEGSCWGVALQILLGVRMWRLEGNAVHFFHPPHMIRDLGQTAFKNGTGGTNYNPLVLEHAPAAVSELVTRYTDVKNRWAAALGMGPLRPFHYSGPNWRAEKAARAEMAALVDEYAGTAFQEEEPSC